MREIPPAINLMSFSINYSNCFMLWSITMNNITYNMVWSRHGRLSINCYMRYFQLFNTYIQHMVESFIDNINFIYCKPLNAVVTELLQCYNSITIEIHHFEVGFDECFHCLENRREVEEWLVNLTFVKSSQLFIIRIMLPIIKLTVVFISSVIRFVVCLCLWSN